MGEPGERAVLPHARDRGPGGRLRAEQRLADALAAAGAEVTFEIVEGGKHGGPEFWSWHRSPEILGFLDRHLGGTAVTSEADGSISA